MSKVREENKKGKGTFFFEGIDTPLTSALSQKSEFGSQKQDEKILLEIAQEVRKGFPKGLPNEPFDLWSEVQKKLFIELGPEAILWAVGELEFVYPTENEDIHIQGNALVKKFLARGGQFDSVDEMKEYVKKVYIDRDIFALLSIAKLNKENPELRQPIYLIFGKGHKFEKYSGKAFKITREKGI